MISALFSGCTRIQSASEIDAAHIAVGDRGEWVARVQTALNWLEGSSIAVDGVFGEQTKAAILAFKTKRRIINAAYQTSADAIVGKRTVKALDEEVADKERNKNSVIVTCINPPATHVNHKPAISLSFLGGGKGIMSSGFLTSTRQLTGQLSVAPTISPAPNILPGPIVQLQPGQIATINVKNGAGGRFFSSAPNVINFRDEQRSHLATDDETFELVASRPGNAVFVVVYRNKENYNIYNCLTVLVMNKTATIFTDTMVPHNHRPVEDWNKLLGDIEQPIEGVAGAALYALCAARKTPDIFVRFSFLEFKDKPNGMQHLLWYLSDGRGVMFLEDDNIDKWVRSDAGIRARIRRYIQEGFMGNTPEKSGWFGFGVNEFKNMDYYYSFGALDRIDIKIDYVAKTAKIWFRDIYEWHPVCNGYYIKHADDIVRNTNSLHAALVQMKNEGAQDYWMQGESTFPFSLFGF